MISIQKYMNIPWFKLNYNGRTWKEWENITNCISKHIIYHLSNGYDWKKRIKEGLGLNELTIITSIDNNKWNDWMKLSMTMHKLRYITSNLNDDDVNKEKVYNIEQSEGISKVNTWLSLVKMGKLYKCKVRNNTSIISMNLKDVIDLW